MKAVIFAVTLIGIVQCAKLDHLKYLPPDSRPTNKDSFDQGLSAPSTGQTPGSFSNSQQPQDGSFKKSTSFEPQPTASGSFNAGTQNAAHLQGSPFITNKPQESSGNYGGFSSAPQPNQGAGQQATNKPSTISSPFGTSQQFQQSSGQPQKSDKTPRFGSDEDKAASFNNVQSTGLQNTNNFQGSPGFGNFRQNSQFGVAPQQAIQPHSTYGVPKTQSDSNAQSSVPFSTSYTQGSSFGRSGPSSTFPGTTGSSSSVPYDSSFAKNSPVTNNFKSPAISNSFGANSQPSRNFGTSTANDQNKPIASESGRTFGTDGGKKEITQSSESVAPAANSFDTAYSRSNQAPGSFGPGKSSGIFNNGPSNPNQSKYQSSSLNQIPIIRLDTKNYGDGTYSTAYETGNGIQAEEQGQTQGDSTIAQGSYSYTSPEGEKVGVSYTADEDGYHPQGEHLPTPPPVPEAILKSIEYNMAHPEEENDDGSYREPSPSESSGQFKSPFGKTQYSGSSNKYLAPTSGSISTTQFSGSTLSPLIRDSTAATGNNYFSSNKPYTNQATASFSTQPSSSVVQDKSKSSLPASDSSSYVPYSPKPSDTSISDYQSRAPTSFGSASNEPSIGSNRAFPTSTFGNFDASKTFQGTSDNAPAQKTSFSGQSSFNSPSYAPSGSSSNDSQGSSLRKFGDQDSIVVESNLPINSGNEERHDAAAASSIDNASQRTPSSQFSSHQSISGSSNKPNFQYKSSSSPSYPGTVSGQSSFQNYNNGPVKAQGSFQDNKNNRFVGDANKENQPTSRQYQNVPGSPGQQSFQASYSSGPSTTKPTNYQNLPVSQGQQDSHASYSSGPSATKPTQYQNLPGSQRQQSFQASYNSGPSATQQSQFSGYQYNAPNTPFKNSGSTNFQQGSVLKPTTFSSGNIQNVDGASKTPFGSESAPTGIKSQFTGGVNGSSNPKFGSASEPSGIKGEFGAGFKGHTGPIGAPGVQAQDENGGYLYK